MVTKYLMIFFVSMVPLVELRGSIVMAVGMGLDYWTSLAVCVLGNMLPVTLGNLLGGLLVGGTAWYCYLRKKG